MSSPLDTSDPGIVAELGDVLRSAGLTGERVREALGATSDLISKTVDIPLHERRLRAAGPLGTLIRLLVLDEPVPAEDARAAFAPLALDRLEALGVFRQDGDEVLPVIRIVPHDELLIASDRRMTEGGNTPPDHVAGVHDPSLMLSRLTVRRPVRRTLDVGTGSAVQAILAAPRSEHVVGTDINERALVFATFNAQLNKVSNIEFRAGSFFDPVEGERFDLVTCNPPYVISPESALIFRDSGMEGDEVSRLVVERMPHVLEEGGFATMLVSWVAPSGDDLVAPVRTWVDGNGCDAWLLYYGTDDALTHAGKWLRHEAGGDPDVFGASLDRWLEYFERLGIEAVSYGAVVLRRRSGGSNWVRTDKLPGDRLRPASDHIERVFAAQDYLAGLGDEREVLDAVLALAEHTRLEQRVTYRDREWTVDEIKLSLEEGLGFTAGLDPPTAGLLAGLDGTRTLREVADQLARLEGASPATVETAVVPIATQMLAAGFLRLVR